jgi:hypothetical protein
MTNARRTVGDGLKGLVEVIHTQRELLLRLEQDPTRVSLINAHAAHALKLAACAMEALGRVGGGNG